MTKFLIDFEKTLGDNELSYIVDEYSFYMQSTINGVNLDLLINNIDLAIDDNNCITHLSGFCPYGNWIKTNIVIPKYKRGIIRVIHQLKSGFSYRLNDHEWSTYIDEKERWVCIGNPEKPGQAVEFLNHCIAVINQGELVSLWLKPKFTGTLISARCQACKSAR
jgi:hypothetical protein